MSELFEIKRKEQSEPSKFELRESSSDKKAVLDVFKLNAYQRKEFKVGSGNKWIDMGANVGAFSIFCKSLGNEVIAFEAESGNLEQAKKNALLNGFELDVRHQAVVPDSHEGDSITLFIPAKEVAQQWRTSTVYHPKTRKCVEVQIPVLRFSDLKELGADCLKIDIEGSEVDIFAEKPDVSWVKKLVMEWSFDYSRSISKAEEAIAYLKEHFDYVDIDKNLEKAKAASKDGDTWSFFPACMTIYCFNK